MKLALISDVHADVHALADALTRIDQMRCDVIVCAGDLLDGGLFPDETIRLLDERRIPTIRGNHDRWALGGGSAHDPQGHGAEHDASGWDLSGASLTFLRSLPASWTATLEGVRVAVHHASPGSDMIGVYPEDLERDASRLLASCDADVLLVGHTHLAFAHRTPDGRLIANPGALLRDGPEPATAWMLDAGRGRFAPATRPTRGTFGVLHLPERRFVVHRADDGTVILDSHGEQT